MVDFSGETQRFMKVLKSVTKGGPWLDGGLSKVEQETKRFARGVQQLIQHVMPVGVRMLNHRFHRFKEPLHFFLERHQPFEFLSLAFKFHLGGREFVHAHAHVSGVHHLSLKSRKIRGRSRGFSFQSPRIA